MKKISALLYLFAAAMLHAQSLTATQNYIYTRTYLEPVTTSQPAAQQVQEVRYFDALGRNIQNTAIKASPSGKDLIIPVTYDALGRQTKSYLPLPVDTQNGAYMPGVGEAAVNAYYGVPNAYSEAAFESSPLGRVEKTASPGAEWQMSGSHTQKIEYAFNNAGEVKRFNVAITWDPTERINNPAIGFAADDAYTTGGYYKAGTLYKNITKDEDDQETTIFTNSLGQRILVRKVNKKENGSSENLDTYYVYDDFGNLSFIIPPKAAVLGTIAQMQAALNTLCYQYKYDRFNRLAEKKLPGKDWEYMVYDKQDRLVLEQDGNLRTTTNGFTARGWMFTKYDAMDRVLYAGFFAGTASRSAMQAALDNFSANPLNNERRNTVPFVQDGLNIYYTKDAFPTGSMTVLSVNYYDEYPQGTAEVPAQILGQEVLGDVPLAITSNGYSSIRSLKTMPTVSYVRNVENESWNSDIVWYDRLGQPVGSEGKNHLGGFTRTESLLDFSGKPLETFTYHSKKTSSTEVTVKDRFVYNPQNFLLKHYQQIDSKPEELLADYTYNDLGQVTNKKTGGGLQSIDYTYNVKGWLTGINAADIGTMGSKLFAYKLKYNSVEGAESPNSTYSSLKVKPKYNGRIVEVDWKTAYGANEPLRRYGYVYDGAERLRAGFFQNGSNPYTKEYSEIVDYDLNGNISQLTRTGAMKGGAAEVMDDLRYSYLSGGNQLNYVEETGSGNGVSGYPLAMGTGQQIKYDQNGNMTAHPDKGHTKIVYNFLNLPSEIIATVKAKSQNYIYASDGTKLQMKQDTEVTDYLGNFQYASNTLTGTDTLSTLANEEGYYDFTNNRYVYQYKDHLGNIRISYAKGNGSAAIILEENNYYPFGLKHAGYNSGDTTNNKFKYLYNGKELLNGGNLDYGWRQYMPDLGRWNGMDQLAESYHPASPYAYVINNPVSFMDPDGRDVKPTAGGYEFTGSDIISLFNYLKNGGSFGSLTGALSSWEEQGSNGNFWSYFGSWRTFGATASSSAGGNIYVTTIGDGAMGANQGEVRAIQEIVFTRKKIGSVQSLDDWKKEVSRSARQPGRAMMMDSMFEVLVPLLSRVEPETQIQALGLAALAVILTKAKAAPGIIKGELAVEASSIKMAGRLGNQATREQIAQITAKLESRGYTVTRGGGKFPEEYLKPLIQGRKGGSYLDITATHPSYPTLRINTVDVLRDGITPTARELRNAIRIRTQIAPGEHLLLIPKIK